MAEERTFWQKTKTAAKAALFSIPKALLTSVVIFGGLFGASKLFKSKTLDFAGIGDILDKKGQEQQEAIAKTAKSLGLYTLYSSGVNGVLKGFFYNNEEQAPERPQPDLPNQPQNARNTPNAGQGF